MGSCFLVQHIKTYATEGVVQKNISDGSCIPFENLHHVILGVPPKFQIVGGRVFLCRRFLGVFDESVLQGSTLTG